MEVPHQSLPVCSHMAVVERVASVIPGSVAGEHAVPSTSFGNGHLHILRVIQGTTHTHTLQPFLKHKFFVFPSCALTFAHNICKSSEMKKTFSD